MKETKILFVKGDSDYAALSFEQSGVSKLEAWNDAVAQGGSYDVIDDMNDYTVKALCFGEVDDSFIGFVQKEFTDYDDTKHTNFYIVN